MKKIGIIFMMAQCFLICSSQENKFPEAEISNGVLTVNFFLPDINNGYYRATRFDWSGNTSNLDYNGHSYYGKWYDKYEPTIHDVVMGPVEEFGPVGFSEAKTGEGFIKIGVGALTKPDDTPYNSFKLYKIDNPGKWKVKKRSSEISFLHKLKDGDYGYTYIKTVRLTEARPEMVIEHTLINNGEKSIETSVYNHNFLMIDKEPTGPNYKIVFPYEVSGECRGTGESIRFEGNTIKLLRNLTKGESIFCGNIVGIEKNSDNYNITVENTRTGAGVRITSKESLSKLVFWASPTTVCPEPYTDIKLEPGNRYSWSINYEYYMTNK